MLCCQAMRDMMEENYKKWHNHTEQQLAAHVAAAEDKAAADAEAQRRRWGIGRCRRNRNDGIRSWVPSHQPQQITARLARQHASAACSWKVLLHWQVSCCPNR